MQANVDGMMQIFDNTNVQVQACWLAPALVAGHPCTCDNNSVPPALVHASIRCTESGVCRLSRHVRCKELSSGVERKTNMQAQSPGTTSPPLPSSSPTSSPSITPNLHRRFRERCMQLSEGRLRM